MAASRTVETRSGSPSEALSSAPATKPNCRPIVNHDCCAPESDHSVSSCGTTAEAENHSDMASSWARQTRTRLRAWPSRVVGAPEISLVNLARF